MKKVISKINNLKRETDIKIRVNFKSRTFRESLIRNQNCKSLIFIGLPRSGTSVVYDILNAHGKIYMSYELAFQPLLYLPKKKQFPIYHALIRQSCMLNNNQFVKTGFIPKKAPFEVSYDYFGDKMIFQNKRAFYQKLKSALIQNRADKLVCIVRDPFDRYISYVKWVHKRKKELPLTEKESKNNTIEVELDKWNAFTDRIMKLHKLAPKKVRILSYEKLLADSEKTIRSLEKFLGVDPFDIDADKLFKHSQSKPGKPMNVKDGTLMEKTKQNFQKLNAHFDESIYGF